MNARDRLGTNGDDGAIAVSLVAYDGYDLATAMQSIRDLGFAVVELAHIAGNSETFDEANLDRSHADQARRLLARYGLRCRTLSAHMDLSANDAVAAMQRRLAYAHTVGARYVATKSAPAERRAACVKNLRQIAPFAAELGIDVLLENPSASGRDVVDDGSSGAAFLDELGLENVAFNYDFGNLLSHRQGELRPETDFLGALPHVAHLHLKDVRRSDRGWVHTAIGEGDIDYAAVFARLRREERWPYMSLEVPLRLQRHFNGEPFSPLPPPPFGEIEAVLRRSMGFVRTHLE